MKWRSAWLIFYGPVILPYILKTIWCIYIICSDYESVWPQTKCRSQWPVFHCPVFLLYIFKTSWCINIILWDYESVWHDFWLQNKCLSLLIFLHMSQYDPLFDLKLFVGHCDLYCMSSDFAAYLENYSVAEHHTLGLRVSMTRHLTSPGRLAQSGASLTANQEVAGSSPDPATFFCWNLVMKKFLRPFSTFRWLKKAVVSYWRKNGH